MEAYYQKQRFAPCDTFFVESAEISRAEQQREHQRLLAKERQREIAAELSAITSDEYLEEILDHMEHMEELTMPDVASIDIQHEIQWYMRPYLLDFLIEAHSGFHLHPETLYLTINILDRYCSKRVVYKRHYQLVACAALLIASKFGDKKELVPTLRELRSLCCNMYEEEMFMQMEWHVLQTLDYLLGHPTVDSFLQIALADTAPDDVELLHMTWYLCELSLYQRDFISVRPSVLGRSALALARFILGREQMSTQEWAGRYETDVIYGLHKLLEQPSSVLRTKFSNVKLSSVAQVVEIYLQVNCTNNEIPEDTKSVDSGYAEPSTPQKQMYDNALVQHGCLTPPITPESEVNACLDYPPPHMYPSTPSPVPSHHAYHHPLGSQQYPVVESLYGM